jgi:hypothetical protein
MTRSGAMLAVLVGGALLACRADRKPAADGASQAPSAAAGAVTSAPAVPDDFVLEIGSSGGIAGMISGFRVEHDGAVVRFSNHGDRPGDQRVGTLPPDAVAALYREVVSARFFELKGQEPQCCDIIMKDVSVTAQGKKHRVGFYMDPPELTALIAAAYADVRGLDAPASASAPPGPKLAARAIDLAACARSSSPGLQVGLGYDGTGFAATLCHATDRTPPSDEKVNASAPWIEVQDAAGKTLFRRQAYTAPSMMCHYAEVPPPPGPGGQFSHVVLGATPADPQFVLVDVQNATGAASLVWFDAACGAQPKEVARFPLR